MATKRTDNQGNPIDEDGKLIVEKINSIDELTDGDFMEPSRSVALPEVPDNVDKAIGAEGKAVVIKKNVFEKNGKRHRYTPQESRNILAAALYNPDLVGRVYPKKRGNNWVVIKVDCKNPIAVLEVSNKKDNVEIIGWYTLDERNLERIKRQVKREDGELLILTSNDAAASLSTLPYDLSFGGKGNDNSETHKEYIS